MYKYEKKHKVEIKSIKEMMLGENSAATQISVDRSSVRKHPVFLMLSNCRHFNTWHIDAKYYNH